MKKSIARFIMKLIGWKVVNNLPPDVKKCVVMMAPHTSNWDFLLGFLGYMTIGINSKYLIKKEAFVFPLGNFLRAVGAIPVDRKASTNIVLQVGELFKKSDSLYITITPEGTRSLSWNWKRGFYYIAENAGVPIAFGFLDYKTKVGGIGRILMPGGDFDADLKQIEDFYKDINPRFPEKFSLSPENRTTSAN
jgi:1-acyl-sn-glycerol-3-phosphate acyltransferase